MNFPQRVVLRAALRLPSVPEARKALVKGRTDEIPASTTGIATSLRGAAPDESEPFYYLVTFADQQGEWEPAWIRGDLLDFPGGWQLPESESEAKGE